MKPVGDNEYKRYIDYNLVYESRLRIIAVKIIKKINLSLREKSIFEGKTKEVNEIIIKIKKTNQQSKL